MQTFLPYADFVKTAKTLDYRRLGKQRVEAMQILNVLTGKQKKGWQNHPAVLMWKGHEAALMLYHNVMIDEWKLRGYRNNMVKYDVSDRVNLPEWIGDIDFHASHKSNLLRKDPVWYAQYGWNIPDNLEYVWPKNNGCI